MREPDKGGGWVCGLCIGLHLKSVLVGKLFTISRNWPTIRGAVPLDQREPRSQSIRIQEGRERERGREGVRREGKGGASKALPTME